MEGVYKLLNQTKSGSLQLTKNSLFNRWLNSQLQNDIFMDTFVCIFKSIESTPEVMNDPATWKQIAKAYLTDKKYSSKNVDLVDDYIDALIEEFGIPLMK